MQQFTSLEVLHVLHARYNTVQEELRLTPMTRDQIYEILRSLPNPTLLRKFLIELDLDGQREPQESLDLAVFEALDEILGNDDAFQELEDVSLVVWPLSKAPSQALIEETMPRLHERNILHVEH